MVGLNKNGKKKKDEKDKENKKRGKKKVIKKKEKKINFPNQKSRLLSLRINDICG